MALNAQADFKPLRSAKSTAEPDECWPNTGLECLAMKMSKPSQRSALLPMELPSMSSRQAFPAKISALPANELEWEAKPDPVFGQKSCAFVASLGPDRSSWKTSQTCFPVQPNNEEHGLADFSGTWPPSGMMLSGTVYQLPTLVPGIGGAEFGWLPTPTASSDSKGSPKGRYFGSDTCMANLREVLRDGPEDPVYPSPELVEIMMGYPPGFTS